MSTVNIAPSPSAAPAAGRTLKSIPLPATPHQPQPYTGTLDIPTPRRQAYSEGILPRYTFVAAGHIFVEGNGGDLFVLRHATK